MLKTKRMKIWHTLVYLLFFAIGALFYGHLAQAAATSVSIQTPDSINKAYAKPNSTIPVLYYVTADPPGFSAFYGINLIKDGASYSYNQFNRTFLEGSQGYGDDFNVGTPGDGLYDLYINILGAHDTNLSSVVVDGTAPTVPTVIYPSASGIYLKPSNPVLIRWTASTDANFGATPIRVVYSLTGTFLDGVTIVNLPATATSTTWYPPAVNVNTAKVAVIATDLAGNTINDVSNYAFTIDNTAPVIKAGAYVVLSSPATPGATATDNYTSGANLTYAWSQVSGPGSISFSNNAILNPVISASVSGTYVASLTVTDQAGNQSTDTFSFLWDGNPGAFNITAPTIGQIIRGSSNTSVAWTLPPDSDLSHFDIHYSTNNGGDWTLVTSNLASTTTSYSWAVPAANSDQSVVRVTAYDVDGNNTPSVSDSFIIDSTAPSITITSPNLGIINTPTASGASATDVNGIASYAWTKFSGPGTITFATSSTIANPTMAADADGAYVARLTVTDNAGNTSTSDVSFTWDTTGPDITIANANLGAINTPTASGASATDANGVASYAWTKVSGPGTITFAPSATSTDPVMSASEDGAYVARFTVTDTVGNSSTSDVNFTWDTTAPNITITNSNLGAIRVATASGASASDTNGIASYAWTKVSGTGTITFSSSATIANPTMAANTDGAYVARLTVTDNAGNTSTSDVSFIWDTTGPDITITNASLGAINTPTASGASATDANGVASYAWTKVSGPGTITFAASAAIANPTMAANTNGVYVARLTVTDMAGNTNTSDVNFIWDTIAPTITITNSNLGAIRVATASGASASDTNGIASYSWAKFSGPGTITFASSATIANPTMSADADGAYVARLTVTDNAGNTNNANVNFTWDSTAPVITINPITPDPTGDSTPTFTGNATDALNNISGVEYQVDGGGSWIACTAADGSFNSSNENYTCTISPALIEDVHIVNVRSTDAIGNTSDGSVSDTFTVNLSGPSITPMSDRAEKVQFNQDATTVNATSWLWSFTGPGTITFGTP
ncbi:MAG: Ig-like domain repeat protein, partial [bacterium]|nr:Ig-like domain repeat protein [bacterium]